MQKFFVFLVFLLSIVATLSGFVLWVGMMTAMFTFLTTGFATVVALVFVWSTGFLALITLTDKILDWYGYFKE